MTQAQKSPSQTPIPASWMMPAEATTRPLDDESSAPARPAPAPARGASRLWYLLPLVVGFVGAIAFASFQPRRDDTPPPPVADKPAVAPPAAHKPASVAAAEAAVRPPDVPETSPPAPPTDTGEAPPADAPAARTDQVGELESPAPVTFELKELPVHKKIKKLVLRAESYLRKEEFNEAERVLKRAIRLDPNYPLPYRTLGIVRARDENYDGARWAYQKYLKLAPHAPDAPDVRRILGQ